jgi:hypothetical protein
MTIDQMINEMENTLKEIKEIGFEIKFKQNEKLEIFTRVMKHNQEWAFELTQRVITNKRKADITKFYKQSQVALKHAKRVQAQ